MKTKLTKIFLLTLTLAMVIGMAVGFTASAEGEAAAESVAIVSQKIDYAGTTHLYFAVKYENVANPEKIALNVSYVDSNGEAKEVTITESEEVTLKDSAGNDVTCRAFMTPGVDAKSFTHKFVAQAVTEAGTESAEKTYSVTEYCLEWLTYIATQAEPTDYELKIKDACEATLAYGTKIQALLGYYPAENDYPENYVYVKGTDGVKVNGADVACVIKGSEVALTYEGTETRLGWEVADLAGTEITVTDDKFTATANCIAGPELTDATGKYYLDSTAKGTRIDYDVAGTELPGGEASGLLSITDGYLLFDGGEQENAEKYINFAMPSVDTSGFASVCTVVEFDLAYGTFWYNWPVFLRFSGTDRIYFRNTLAAPDTFNKMEGTDTSTSIDQSVDKFFNLRLEMYNVTTDGTTVTVAKLYINNVYVKDITSSTQVTAGRLIIAMTSGARNAAGGDPYLKIDNVYLGAVDKAFVAGDPNATPAE